jgi:ATP-binding cassette subfamily B protein
MSIREMLKFMGFQTKGYRIINILVFVGVSCGAAYAYVTSIVYAKVIDTLMMNNYEKALTLAIILVVSVLVLKVISSLCRSVFDHYITPSMYETRKRTARKAMNIEYCNMESEDTLTKLRRIKVGESATGNIVTLLSYMYGFFLNLAKTVFALGFLITLIVKVSFANEVGIVKIGILTVLMVLLFVALFYVSFRISAAIGKRGEEVMRENEKSNAVAGYVLDGAIDNKEFAKDIALYDMADYFINKLWVMVKAFDKYVAYGGYTGRMQGLFAIITQIAAGYVYIYVVIMALSGTITTGDVLMYAGSIITLMTSIQGVLMRYQNIKYINDYVKNYEEFINSPNMDYDGTLPVEKRDDNKFELAFKDVSFKYLGSEEYILKNVSLKFNIGERVALVGLNGAGKTTLIKLLLRFYEPTEGEITLNGINISKYDYDEYMTIFSVVFQDFNLFDFPLDEVIAASTDVDSERVRKVIDMVGLRKLVDEMPDKEHSLLGNENGTGVGLSGGEAQKVAIARALYKGAPFVILDEPTAALDPVAEAEVYENFDKLVGNKTSIYISHRMSSCKFCDRIVVIDGGKIAEEGNHSELIAHNGIYAKLYNTQAAYYTA